jgi:hypothetical protein
MDDADVDLVTAPGDTKCKNISAASAATLSLPTDRSTNINVVASSAMDGGGVNVTRSIKYIGETRPPRGDVVMEALLLLVVKITIMNAAADDKRSKIPTAGPSTAAALSLGSVLKSVTTVNASADGVSKLSEPVDKDTILSDNISQSTGQISDTTPEEKGNLKNDEDYESGEQGDPWDFFSFSEINDQYYAVAVGRNEKSFGIYADVRMFKEEIEGFPESLYESCKSYAQAHKYLEEYLHQ